MKIKTDLGTSSVDGHVLQYFQLKQLEKGNAYQCILSCTCENAEMECSL